MGACSAEFILRINEADGVKAEALAESREVKDEDDEEGVPILLT